METAVPVYAVKDVAGYERDYKQSRISHHVDENWRIKMDRMEFSIWPEQKEDHSLEAWVLGFVYGFVKYEDEKYKIYSQEKGDQLDDYWMDLSSYRDESFEIFKKEGLVEETINLVESEQEKAGTEITNSLIDDVVKNYRVKFSQINLSPDELKKREYKRIADLLRSEIDFTVKELSKLR
jgi:hypothetical protein